MAKPQKTYVCGECGAATIKWQGQCPACGEWNALQTAPAARPAAAAARDGWAGGGIAQD
ncbi:MAG: DNA repair protein RadA, partial [Gammaproteobacteria bacterium]